MNGSGSSSKTISLAIPDEQRLEEIRVAEYETCTGECNDDREWLLELVDQQAEQLKRTYCTYCGAEFPLDDDAGNQVTEHIFTCKQHPMWGLQEQVREMEADLKGWSE